jgi:hypothetical protein
VRRGSSCHQPSQCDVSQEKHWREPRSEHQGTTKRAPTRRPSVGDPSSSVSPSVDLTELLRPDISSNLTVSPSPSCCSELFNRFFFLFLTVVSGSPSIVNSSSSFSPVRPIPSPISFPFVPPISSPSRVSPKIGPEALDSRGPFPRRSSSTSSSCTEDWWPLDGLLGPAACAEGVDEDPPPPKENQDRRLALTVAGVVGMRGVDGPASVCCWLMLTSRAGRVTAL